MARLKGKGSRSSQRVAIAYMDDVRRPVSSLVFLLPLVILYEIGTYWTASNLSESMINRVIAFQLLRRFFALFGATWIYLPGLALVAILTAWQLATADTWKIRWRTVGAMGIESLMLAVPLVVLSHVVSYVHATRLAASGGIHDWMGNLLLSVGAGIYEELLFRLMLISLLSIVLIDLVHMAEGPAIFAIVLISAAFFSLYHNLGAESFRWSLFMFRAVAGGYLAGIFILRGFGITVGCHVIYDILATIINTFSEHSS
jgi:hypothetical protein